MVTSNRERMMPQHRLPESIVLNMDPNTLVKLKNKIKMQLLKGDRVVDGYRKYYKIIKTYN